MLGIFLGEIDINKPLRARIRNDLAKVIPKHRQKKGPSQALKMVQSVQSIGWPFIRTVTSAPHFFSNSSLSCANSGVLG